MSDDSYDIFVIGGGVNGCGIARDAAGRGLKVALAEKDDLASGTSSASTKLFHGGLRYLEYYEFRLVREALREREVLLKNMPHISWPMRFVLPLHRDMRPAWLIRLGLFIYDHLGGRRILPPTKTLDLTRDEAGKPLKPFLKKAFEYSDCWVQDARLVVLNAVDAARRGARIMTRAKVVAARREGDLWHITIERAGRREVCRARTLVNAAGPWVADVLGGALGLDTGERVRLVRGSHIVVRRLYDHDKAYFFQGRDRRIIFAIPFEQDFTLIGTTDVDQSDMEKPVCSRQEADYLCDFASEYFREPVRAEDIVWTYSGVRPLYDDGASSATEATRDYVLSVQAQGPAVLNVFGGKITTYRRLAEAALDKLAPHLGGIGAPWTARAPLPGGDFPWDGADDLIAGLMRDYPFLAPAQATRLVRAYGTDAARILGPAKTAADLGEDFGAGLSEAEVRWLIDNEFAVSAEDILWRRSKLGLKMPPEGQARLAAWLAAQEGQGGQASVERAS